MHIRHIRASPAESDYEYVHTARGLGYRFEAHPKGLKEGDENRLRARDGGVTRVGKRLSSAERTIP